MNNFFKIIFILCIVNNTLSYSQNRQQSLLSKLDEIENKYGVSFSYKDAIIKNIEVDFVCQDNESLEHLLKRLQAQTGLRYNLLSDKFVTINAFKGPVKQKPYLEKLEAVHIANYLTSGIVKNTNGGVSISPAKTGVLPGLIEPDILQTIQALPGVLSANEDVSNINVRGGTSDQNLVLYDGIKMYQTGHFFGLISAFNSNLINKVSVYRHGTQAQYGDAVSSVVNMRLLDDVAKPFKAGVGANLISTDGFAIVPLKKNIAIQVSARRSTTDVAKTPIYKKYFERIFQDSDLTNVDDAAVSKNENFYFYDAALKVLYDISKKDKLRFNILSIDNQLDYEEEAIINITNTKTKSKLKQQSLALGLNYAREWNAKFNTNLLVYISDYKLNGENNNILQNQVLIQDNSVSDYGLKFDFTKSFTEGFNLLGGYQLSQVNVTSLEDLNNPQFKRITKQFLTTHAPYVEARYNSFNTGFTSRFGLRSNILDKFNLNLIEPRFYVSKRFMKHFRVDVSGEYKSQTISQVIDLQNDFLGVEKRRWVLADNAVIPIIKSKQATLGLAYKKSKLLVSAEAFVKDVKGITTRGQGFQNQYQYVYSTGNYKIKGLDFLVQKRFYNFNAWLSYSLSKNNYNFKSLNEGVTFPNNFDINHVLNLSSTYKFNNLKIALGLNWHSAKPSTKPVVNLPVLKNTVNYQGPNSSRLPNYFRIDISSTYKFKIWENSAIIGASIWNVLNKENIVNSYYQLTTNNRVSQVNNNALFFTPNLSFRYWF